MAIRRSSRTRDPAPQKLILRSFLSPGDVVMLTAAVRDLHLTCPGRFLTDVRTPCPDLWNHNPRITPIADDDPDAVRFDCHYPLIHQSNRRPVHFIRGYIADLNARLGLNIEPSAFKGDIRLSRQEKRWMSQVQEITLDEVPFWIIVAGGKLDFTIKWWDHERWQKVVDHFRGKILFVQVGEDGHHHPALDGVLDLRGRTDLRQLVRLVYHAQGVVCPVTLLMHLAAAVEVKGRRPLNRPCVVVAGGREPMQWEAYPHHQFIHTNGALLCCDQGGCWKSRTVPLGDGNDDKDRRLCLDVVDLETGERRPGREWGTHDAAAPTRRLLPRCMDMISAAEVIRRIEMYFQGGTAQYLTPAERRAANRALPGRRRRRLFSAPPKIGLVVGTFAAVPYVHLQLETRKRLNPSLPLLVHDDNSPRRDDLERLCAEYGAGFASTDKRQDHGKGDLCAIARGFLWAREQSLDLLVKVSRRFVPLKPWTAGLADLAMTSQFATYSSWTVSYGFGFRTECVAFAVREWFSLGLVDEILAAIRSPEGVFVECMIHRLAMRAATRNSRAAAVVEASDPRLPDRRGYAVWPFMGFDRVAPTDNYLWHDWASPADYAALARRWKLPWKTPDFRDPNMGAGIG